MTTSNAVCLLIGDYRGGYTGYIHRYGTFKPVFDSERLPGGFRALRIHFHEAEIFISDAHLFANTEPANQTPFYKNLLAKIERSEPVAVGSIVNMLNKLTVIARTKNAISCDDLSTLWQVINHFLCAQNCAVFAAQSALHSIFSDYEN